MLDRAARACDVSQGDSRREARPCPRNDAGHDALPNDLIGVATSYAELIALIERRRCELGLTFLDMDERAGLATSHYSHLVGWDGKHGRNLGPATLPRVLGALGIGIAIVELEQPERGARNVAMVRGKRKAA